MKTAFEIKNNIEKIRFIHSALKTDQHFSKTFEGEFKNGKLIGFYRFRAKYNRPLYGYLKIKGHYDLTLGNFSLGFVPTQLFWGVQALIGCSLLFLINRSIQTYDTTILIPILPFSLVSIGSIAGYYWDKHKFLKHLNRIADNFTQPSPSQ